MNTEISQNIDKACHLLRMGEVVALPTETVYGLAANALNEEGVKKIFEIKGRPLFNPLILHFSSKAKAVEAFAYIPDWANQLMDCFWPGPLTLVLPKVTGIPDLVTSGKQTVAVRVPSHPMMLAVLKEIDFPLAAPSANLFGRISPTRPEHVLRDLKGKVAMILDGGPCVCGIESTIIGMDKDGSPLLLRYGSISLERIERVIGKVRTIEVISEKPSAPGMLLSHYAPLTPAFMVSDVHRWMNRLGDMKIGMMCFTHVPKSKNVQSKVLSNSGDLNEAARALYQSMHALDALEMDLLLFEILPESGLGIAINDKLKRATRPTMELRKFLRNEF